MQDATEMSKTSVPNTGGWLIWKFYFLFCYPQFFLPSRACVLVYVLPCRLSWLQEGRWRPSPTFLSVSCESMFFLFPQWEKSLCGQRGSVTDGPQTVQFSTLPSLSARCRDWEKHPFPMLVCLFCTITAPIEVNTEWLPARNSFAVFLFWLDVTTATKVKEYESWH